MFLIQTAIEESGEEDIGPFVPLIILNHSTLEFSYSLTLSFDFILYLFRNREDEKSLLRSFSSKFLLQ